MQFFLLFVAGSWFHLLGSRLSFEKKTFNGPLAKQLKEQEPDLKWTLRSDTALHNK